jgi:hypothetical protein
MQSSFGQHVAATVAQVTATAGAPSRGSYVWKRLMLTLLTNTLRATEFGGKPDAVPFTILFVFPPVFQNRTG